MSADFMPEPPHGCRWFAYPSGEGWLVLSLGPEDWSDEQMRHPDFHNLDVWPNSLPGMCGIAPDLIASMARQLIARFHERFPVVSQTAAMAELINGGVS